MTLLVGQGAGSEHGKGRSEHGREHSEQGRGHSEQDKGTLGVEQRNTVSKDTGNLQDTH